MRKRVYIALAVVLMILAGVIAWQVLRHREPVYQGKTLLSWILQHANSSTPPNQDRAAREAAEVAIRHIGTNGLPILLAWAGRGDATFKNKTLTPLSEEMRAKLQTFSASDSHAAASYGFGVLGSIAKPAVPGLIKLLSDTDPNIRSGAAFSLCQIGPEAEEAVPTLLQSLDDPETLDNAFAALRSISMNPDVVMPVLIGYLSSTNMGHQGWALSRLPEFGADAKKAIPRVQEMLDDPQLYLRQAATNTLKKIDPEAAAKEGVK